MSAEIQIFLPTWNIFSDAAGVRVRVGGDHGDVRGLGVRGGRGGLRGSELGHGDGGQLLERLVPVPAPLLPHRGAHARGIRGTRVDISTFYLYYLLHTGSLGCIDYNTYKHTESVRVFVVDIIIDCIVYSL